jgi:hypothetical protein
MHLQLLVDQMDSSSKAASGNLRLLAIAFQDISYQWSLGFEYQEISFQEIWGS